MSTSAHGGAAGAGAGTGAGAAGAGAGAAGTGAGAGGHARESLAHLVKMANDIGHFFQAEDKHEDAVVGVANHIRKFWTPRMREKMLKALEAPTADPDLPKLEALPREAFAHIAIEPSAKVALGHGADAGGDAG